MRADSTASCPPLVTSQDGSCLLSDTAVKLPSGGSLFGSTKAAKGMKHFLLFYEAGPDYLERRPEFRAVHLDHAWAAQSRGELVVAGALADPVDGAVLMFAGKDRSGVEEFARADPYVINGLVARWRVRE